MLRAVRGAGRVARWRWRSANGSPAAGARPAGRVRGWLGGVLARNRPLLVGVVLWEVAGWGLGLPWLPPFSRVLAAAVDLTIRGQILGSLGASLSGLAVGYGISALGGVTIGALMARFRTVEYALDMYVNAMLLAPSIVFAPIFLTFFGLSDVTRIAVIVLFTMFIVILTTQTGFQYTDPALLDMARSFGATDRQLFFRIAFPAALPLVLAGLRLGMGRAVKGMVNGEMFIALVGLGALIQRYGGQFDSTRVLAVTLVIIVAALVAVGLIRGLDRRLTSWVD